MGMQDGMDWKAVGMGALAGAVTAGLGEALGPIVNTGGILTQSAMAGAQAAVANAATQGLEIAVGLKDDWSWRDVAASAAGASVGSMCGEAAADLSNAGLEGRIAAGTLTGTVSSTVATMVRGGKIEMAQIAADAFGNAMGNAIGDEMVEDLRTSLQREAAEELAKQQMEQRVQDALGLRLSNSVGFDYDDAAPYAVEPLPGDPSAVPEPEAAQAYMRGGGGDRGSCP
jgi:hypothetical protein